MAVDGNWNLVMTTPMGDRNATLSVKSAGGTLTGTQAADGNSTEIFDGTVNGDDLAWKVSITNPMPLTLEFTGKVAGDAISGQICIGKPKSSKGCFPSGRQPFGSCAAVATAQASSTSSRLAPLPIRVSLSQRSISRKPCRLS